MDGGVTNVQIGGDAETVSLTGTTNGNDQTSANYKQNVTVDVGEYQNSSFNPYHHIALGVHNGIQFGLNPKSDSMYLRAFRSQGLSARVPGAVKPQVGGQLLRMIHIPATGMQAQMLQNSIMQSGQNPPDYTVLGQGGCDCANWAQQMLGDAGINTGSPEPMPDNAMDQIHLANPQAPQE